VAGKRKPTTAQVAAEKLRALDRHLRPAVAAPAHPKQDAFIADCVVPGSSVQVRCSRRAGKTFGICKALKEVATSRTCNSVYFGLTSKSVHRAVWLQIWLPLIRAECPDAKNTEADHLTIFPNGSTVVFLGTDDLKFVETALGSSIDGMAVIDESQSQSDEILDALVDRILPPALSDDRGGGSGTLVISGTIPEAPVGRAHEYWHAENGYRKHSWCRFDNPHLKNQQRALDDFLAKRPALSMESPVVQRDWFGVEVFDPNARAWTGFVDALYPDGNLYEGEPPPCEFYSSACDPGGQDRYAIETIGWSRTSPLVYHVDEWCTEREAGVPLSVVRDQCIRIDNRFRPIAWAYDSNSQNTNDTFTSDFGILLIKPAVKSDFRGQFDRMNDLLAQRRLLIRKDSVLHRDMVKARLNPKAYANGGDPWHSSYHGDAHDAARYALNEWWAARPKPPRPVLNDIEREQAALEKIRTSRPKPKEPQTAMDVISGGRAPARDLVGALAASLGYGTPPRTSRPPSSGYGPFR